MGWLHKLELKLMRYGRRIANKYFLEPQLKHDDPEKDPEDLKWEQYLEEIK